MSCWDMPWPSSVMVMVFALRSKSTFTALASASQAFAITSAKTAGVLLYRYKPRWFSTFRLMVMRYFGSVSAVVGKISACSVDIGSPHDSGADGSSELQGHGVADVPRQLVDDEGRIFVHEVVVAREGLQEGGFSNRDGAVLLRVAEAARAVVAELRGDRGRWRVPAHAAVGCWVVGVSVAGVDEVVVPVAPRSPGLDWRMRRRLSSERGIVTWAASWSWAWPSAIRGWPWM